ncbi:MAG: hypothetical protein ACXABG_16085 [Promethearchaeota archaeon]|jgi:DNA-binding transcriptional regulator GbsR (MarR family)
MPRGNAEETDQELLHRLSKFERPVTVNDLVLRLKWSRGKIDGSLSRLVEKQAIAVVNISKPKGQRQRFIGIPDKSYWYSFYETYIVKHKSVLIYDTIGVIKRLLKDSEAYSNQNTLDGQFLSTMIDAELTDVILPELDRIKKIAIERNISSAEFLKTGLQQILDPNFDLLARIALVVINESQSKVETNERAVALSFLEQASMLK